MTELQGFLRKLGNHWQNDESPIQVKWRFADQDLELNPFLGKKLTLKHTGLKKCISCGRDIKKTFQSGYCFPCTQNLAETDMCIVKPELCHFHNNTCRDNEFAKKHCFIPHVVYLANSSHIKVGITRAHQRHTRWADQGASEAITFAEVPDRKTAGFFEVAMTEFISDKSNWRKMLMNVRDSADLLEKKQELVEKVPEEFRQYLSDESQVTQINFPVLEYPKKVSSYNFDKTPEISDTLMGMKGQYLLLKNGVLNVRKFQGYEFVLDIQ